MAFASLGHVYTLISLPRSQGNKKSYCILEGVFVCLGILGCLLCFGVRRRFGAAAVGNCNFYACGLHGLAVGCAKCVAKPQRRGLVYWRFLRFWRLPLDSTNTPV